MKATHKKIELSFEQTTQLAKSTEKYIIAWANSLDYPIPFMVSLYEGESGCSGCIINFLAIVCIVFCGIVSPITLIFTIPLVLYFNLAWYQQFNEIFNKWINEEKYENLPQSVIKFRSEYQDSQKLKKSSKDDIRNYQGSAEYRLLKKNNPDLFKTQAKIDKNRNHSEDSKLIISNNANGMKNYVGSPEYQAMKRNNPHLFKKKALDANKLSEFGFKVIPSKGDVPKGFNTLNDQVKDLRFALKNPSISFRSFFNDCEYFNSDGTWKEETLFCPPFDEILFCKNMQDKNRKDIALKQSQRLKKNRDDQLNSMLGYGILGTIASGSLMGGAMYGNIGARQASLKGTDINAPLDDLKDDFYLKFLSDQGSYISLSDKYKTRSLKRRICMRRILLKEDLVYFDLLPMILFENFATPGQIFKLDDFYCFRPISAGFDMNLFKEQQYNPIKIRRSFAYNPNTDVEKYSKIMQTTISGETIEKEVTLYYAWMKDEPSMNHFYFDYSIDGQLF